MTASKRMKALSSQVDRDKLYLVEEGLKLVKILRRQNLMNQLMQLLILELTRKNQINQSEEP